MTVETAAPVTAPVEVVTPIKPSEALRLGRLIRPTHATGAWFRDEKSACALGAIHIGWGGTPGDWHGSEMETWQRLRNALRGGDPTMVLGAGIFDEAEHDGRDGDAAVLAYFEERGL